LLDLDGRNEAPYFVARPTQKRLEARNVPYSISLKRKRREIVVSLVRLLTTEETKRLRRTGRRTVLEGAERAYEQWLALPEWERAGAYSPAVVETMRRLAEIERLILDLPLLPGDERRLH